MFESLSERLSDAFSPLTKRGALSEDDVSQALRTARHALLEADVALPVARDFIERVQEKAVGEAILRSVSPGQQVVKIVHDELVRMLGGSEEAKDGEIALASPPSVLLMVGLQGSGKTTTTAKLARKLSGDGRKKTLMASLDTSRPAAMEQLALLGRQCSIETLPIVSGQDPLSITKRALQQARLGGYDILLLDSAGRLHVDEELMGEAEAVRDLCKPSETLLVVDALTGQDAVNVAENFHERIGVSGVILTRMDGDGRGGAALSMRAVTGRPIKFIGTGEKLDALEPFHPERVAGRILGMGDVVSLVEKAQETIEKEEADRMMRKMRRGKFDMNDLRNQLEQMQKMGGIGGIASMLPGLGKAAKQLQSGAVDDNLLQRQMAVISSMTKEERRKPEIMQASRKKRVAAGAGVEVQTVNQLLKMHRQLSDMMKKLSKMGGMKALMRGGLGSLFGGTGAASGAMPPANTPPNLSTNMPAGMPPGLLTGFPQGASPPTMPPGFPPGSKKK